MQYVNKYFNAYIHTFIYRYYVYVHTYLHSGDVIFLPLSQSHVCISGVEVCFAFNAGAAAVGQVAVRGRHATYAVVVIQTCNNTCTVSCMKTPIQLTKCCHQYCLTIKIYRYYTHTHKTEDLIKLHTHT